VELPEGWKGCPDCGLVYSPAYQLCPKCDDIRKYGKPTYFMKANGVAHQWNSRANMWESVSMAGVR